MVVSRSAPGRAENRAIVLSRALVGVASRVSTPLAARAAERIFSTPPRSRRSRGQAVLAGGRPFRRWVEGRPIAAWRWGDGPVVLLVHGWGGRAAQMTSFVAPLLDQGLSVVAFDGPGHGRSGRGMSSAPEIARALRAVAESTPGVHAIVAHSLGAAATAIALRWGLRVNRIALLAPMMDPVGRIGELVGLLRVPEAVAAAMRSRSERRIRVAWDELDRAALVGSIAAPTLVVHDRDDTEVPAKDGAAVARSIAGARLVETTGLGHNRILRHPRVTEAVTDFVAEGRLDACRCGAPRPTGASCEACDLEWELFDPGERRRRGLPA